MIAGHSGRQTAGIVDRNPTAQLFSYSTNSIAPHSFTQRWSYTVPTGKKADCLTSLIQIDRQTVAGVSSTFYALIDQTPSGGALVQLSTLQGIINAIGSGYVCNGAIGAHGEAGDVFTGDTGDNSTTGTLMFSLQAGFIEYDA